MDVGRVSIKIRDTIVNTKLLNYLRIDNGTVTGLAAGVTKSKDIHLRHFSKEKITAMYTSFSLPMGSPLKVLM